VTNCVPPSARSEASMADSAQTSGLRACSRNVDPGKRGADHPVVSDLYWLLAREAEQAPQSKYYGLSM